MPYITPLSTTFKNVLRAMKDLSTLGRLQVFILITNVLGTCAVLNVASSEVKHGLDQVVFYFSVEFAVFTMIGILFTITVENVYAFWALIFLQVQLAAFTTASAAIGSLHQQEPWLAWTVVTINWVSIIAFLVLQRAVRQSWGWHAYKLVGGKVDNIAMYDRYQQFCAALIADVFHAIFFVTAEEIVIHSKATWQPGLVWTTVVLTVLLAKVLQISIRRENVAGLVVILVFYVFGFCLYCFFAVENSIEDKPSSDNLSKDNLPSSGERQLVVAIEWCIFLVRGVTLWTMIRTTSFFGQGLAQYFPTGTSESKHYLIDPSSEIAHHQAVRESRAHSHGSTVIVAGGFGGSTSVNAPITGAGTASNVSNYGSASGPRGRGSVIDPATVSVSPKAAKFIDATASVVSSVAPSPEKAPPREGGGSTNDNDAQVQSPRSVTEAVIVTSSPRGAAPSTSRHIQRGDSENSMKVLEVDSPKNSPE